MPETIQEPELTRVTIRASNRVSIEWILGDDEPEYATYSYPSEWADERYSGPSNFEGVISDEELESRVSDATEETREFVEDEFYA